MSLTLTVLNNGSSREIVLGYDVVPSAECWEGHRSDGVLLLGTCRVSGRRGVARCLGFPFSLFFFGSLADMLTMVCVVDSHRSGPCPRGGGHLLLYLEKGGDAAGKRSHTAKGAPARAREQTTRARMSSPLLRVQRGRPIWSRERGDLFAPTRGRAVVRLYGVPKFAQPSDTQRVLVGCPVVLLCIVDSGGPDNSLPPSPLRL